MPPARHLPTHAELTTFLQTHLPPQLPVTITTTKKDGTIHTTTKADVPFLYHTPRHQSYTPTRHIASRIILSITPTSGVYSALHAPHPRSSVSSPVVFLHRPWSLNRSSVPHDALVLASHSSFDTHLTVGWNVALARRLDIDVDGAICIKGYKGEPERKIGLVGRLRTPTALSVIVDTVRREFNGQGELHEHVPVGPEGEDPSSSSSKIEVIAIMNAFHAEEVDRVMDVASDAKWVGDVGDGSQVLYLTGAAREPGLEAAARVNMPAVCVGHRACEEWGISYLAEVMRRRWPELDIVTVLEDEAEVASAKVKHGEAVH